MICSKSGAGRAPRRGISGPCHPKSLLVPPQTKVVSLQARTACAPKKLIGSGILECKLRPETCKIVLNALEFVSKNYFVVIFVCAHIDFHETSRSFWDEDLFFLVFTSEFLNHRTIFEMKTRICKHFWTKDFFLSFYPHF